MKRANRLPTQADCLINGQKGWNVASGSERTIGHGGYTFLILHLDFTVFFIMQKKTEEGSPRCVLKMECKG